MGTEIGRSDQLTRDELLELCDPLLDRRVGVVDVVIPRIMVLQRVVDAQVSLLGKIRVALPTEACHTWAGCAAPSNPFVGSRRSSELAV
jgi:hypothetical protein